MKFEKYIDLFARLDEFEVTQFESYISASQYLLAYQLVLENVPSSASVLDWGTGTGHFSLFLLDEKFKVSGFTIETDFTLAKHLLSDYPDQYNYVADPQAVTKLPFDSNSFDLVTSIGVLEHVRETSGTEIGSLREIERILKPGGYFICYHFPNRFSWIEAIVKYVSRKYNHKYKFSRAAIKQLFNEAQIEMLRPKDTGFSPALCSEIFLTALYSQIYLIFLM